MYLGLLLLLTTLVIASAAPLPTASHRHPRSSSPSPLTPSPSPSLPRQLGVNRLAAPDVDCPLKAFAVQFASYLQPAHASVGNWTREVIEGMGLRSLCNITADDITPPPFTRPSTVPPPRPSSATPNPPCQFEKSTLFTPPPHYHLTPALTSSVPHPLPSHPCHV